MSNNSNFKSIFQQVDGIKERMRNCTTKEQWQELRNEYKQFLISAKAVYLEYSNEDKFNTFLERENGAISAIYTKVKQLWESMEVEKELANRPPKEYVIYNQDNYQQDLAEERKYMTEELFPRAIAERMPNYKVYAEYAYHLHEKPWYNQCGNPLIAFKNECYKLWPIYRNEANGIATPITHEV